jgi:hypothetical protein
MLAMKKSTILVSTQDWRVPDLEPEAQAAMFMWVECLLAR